MRTEIALNGNERPDARFIGWSPVSSAVRLSDTTGATGPVRVRLRNQNTARGGQVVFFSSIPGTGTDTLEVTLPVSGRSVRFHVAGRFQRPSIDDRDATVEVVNVATNQILGSKPIMVRVRKNAVSLTTAERNRFIAAFATLNDRGDGAGSPTSATSTPRRETPRPTVERASSPGTAPSCWTWSASCSSSIPA